MNELEKETIETWDDVRNAFDNILKNARDRFSWHRDILKRYKDVRLSFHIHISGLFFGIPWKGCVSVEVNSDIARLAGPDELSDVMAFDHIKRHSVNVSDGQNQQTMFVFVREILDGKKNFIPSVIRLNALEDIDDRCGNFVFRKLSDLVIESFPILKNREVDNILSTNESGRGIVIGDLPNEVVQTGQGVNNAIAYEQTQSEGWFLLDDNIVKSEIACNNLILVDLEGDFIRLTIQVSPNFISERVQVLLCPDDFDPSSI